jgi:hypothetical protein
MRGMEANAMTCIVEAARGAQEANERCMAVTDMACRAPTLPAWRRGQPERSPVAALLAAPGPPRPDPLLWWVAGEAGRRMRVGGERLAAPRGVVVARQRSPAPPLLAALGLPRPGPHLRCAAGTTAVEERQCGVAAGASGKDESKGREGAAGE